MREGRARRGCGRDDAFVGRIRSFGVEDDDGWTMTIDGGVVGFQGEGRAVERGRGERGREKREGLAI